MMRKLVLLLCLAVALPVVGEEQLAVHVNELRVPQLIGVVLSRSGKPVAGVRVEVIRRETGHTVSEAKTDEQGRFAFPNLKNYRYNIKVHHDGYADFYHVRVTTQKARPELVLKFK